MRLTRQTALVIRVALAQIELTGVVRIRRAGRGFFNNDIAIKTGDRHRDHVGGGHRRARHGKKHEGSKPVRAGRQTGCLPRSVWNLAMCGCPPGTVHKVLSSMQD